MEKMAVTWKSLDSRGARLSEFENDGFANELVTSDPNAWGFFLLSDGRRLLVGYANLGLAPMAVIVEGHLLVGINEILASFELTTLRKTFGYRMPSIFHEFVSLVNPVIVRDEVGFLRISITGDEVWKALTNGPVSRFSIVGDRICGVTIDDEPFAFPIPS